MSADKAWSCQELVDHADNWSLAGNVGLFKHMEQFAEDLFKKADETNNNLENLLEDLDRTEIQLDLVKNQFLSLQNTQFIESRVYEDDETVSEAIVEQAETKLDDGRKKELLRSAVVDGLKVLDKYFEKVSIPESDSEGDETDCSNYVLREKDPYINRPLPYIIGTEEWHTKWHAGLEESSEEEGDDAEIKENGNGRVEDEFSDTDSESNLPVADRRSMACVKDYDNGHREDSCEEVNGNSISAKTPITNATFAEQLAAKLGDVLTTPGTTTDPEVNTRPIQRKQPSAGNSLFPDLPPEIPDDPFGTASGGLFSGGGGLFDDDDDDATVKPPPITTPSSGASNQRKVPNLFDEDDDDDGSDAFLAVPPPISVDEKKRIGGLFDESDDEDEASAAPPSTNKNNAGAPFMPQEPPALESKRKPVGGVNVLGGFLPRRQVSSSSDEDDDNEPSEMFNDKQEIPEKTENVPPSLPGKHEKENKRVLSLFDDTDDLFEDDLFSPTSGSVGKTPKNDSLSSKPKKTSLFDDNDEDFGPAGDNLPPPLFAPSVAAAESKRKAKTRNLFDESSEEEDDMFAAPIALPKTTNRSQTGDVFGEKPNNVVKRVGRAEGKLLVDENVKGDLFKDEMTSKIVKTAEEQEGEERGDERGESVLSKTEGKPQPAVKPRFSLFDDKPPSLLSDDDDEWKDPPVPQVPARKMQEKLAVSKGEDVDKTEIKAFKDVENVEDIKIVKEIEKIVNSKAREVKEEESVKHIEKSPEIKLPGKLKHSLNINVNALMPGARMPRTQVEVTGVEKEDKTDEKVQQVEAETRTSENVTEVGSAEEKPSKVDKATDGVNILRSVTKTRAKIQVKRRPSTRQGRRAALQSSQISSDASETSEITKIEEGTVASSIVPETTKDLPRTSEDLLKTTESHEVSARSEAIDHNKPPALEQPERSDLFTRHEDKDVFDDFKAPKKTVSLFDEDDFESGGIFGSSATAPSAKSPAQASNASTPRKQLIVEDVEDGDDVDVKPPPLFVENENVPEKDKKVEAAAVKIGKKISLFDDLDDFQDSDDLFSAAPPAAENSSPKNLFAKKGVENVRVFDDFVPPVVQGNKVIKEVKTANVKGSLFGEPNDDEDDLFAPKGIPKADVLERQVPKTVKTKSLFGDDDEDDDLFGDVSNRVKARTVKPSEGFPSRGGGAASGMPGRRLEKKNVSLFGDDDDDDDIFNTSSAKGMNVSKPATKHDAVKAPSAAGGKVSKNVAKSDPLADLFGDSD